MTQTGSHTREVVDPLRAWWLLHVAQTGGGPQAAIRNPDAPSVVVCVHDAIDATRACLDSLIAARTVPYRIVIVDDASQPACGAMLASYAEVYDYIHLLQLRENRGYTEAANCGLKQASGQFVVLLNSDTEVAPGWMEAFVACAVSAPHVGLVGPLSNAASWQTVPHPLNPDGTLAGHPMPRGAALQRLCRRLAALSPRRYPRVQILNGFCLGIRRCVLDRIGLLDAEAFPVGFGEENDFCLRARNAGFELLVADDAYVAHRKSASFGHPQREALSRRGDAALRMRHGDARVAAALKHGLTDAALEAARVIARLALAPEHPAPIPFPITKRILFVLPAQAGGGGAHSVVQEVQAMRELGFDARIAVPEPFVPSYLEAYPELCDLELWVQPFADPEALRALADGTAVIVATVFTSVAIIDEAIPVDCGALFAYYIQDYEPLFYAPDAPGRAQAEASYSWERCSVRFAKTHWICAKVEAHHGVPVAKVHPSLEHALYRPSTASSTQEPPTLVAMMRPSTPRRAPERTLRVLARVRARWPGELHIRLFGCARDELAPELASLAEGMELLGPLRRDQVAEVLQSAKIFLDLSDYQAFGRTGLEAMACGCVPLLPLRGGCSEFARHDYNALLVDTDSEDACVEAALDLLNDPDRHLRLRAAGLATAAGFTRLDAAISELQVLASAVENEWRSAPQVADSRARRLQLGYVEESGLPTSIRPGGLPAGIDLEAIPFGQLRGGNTILLALHALLRRHDLTELRHEMEVRGQALVLYYGGDRADLDDLDARLCSPAGLELLSLLKQARCVLVAGEGVADRLRRLGIRVACLPELVDDGGWNNHVGRADAAGPLRLLWIDDDDSSLPCAAQVALKLALPLLGGRIVVDRVRPAQRQPSLHAASSAHSPGFATAGELAGWCAAQSTWHAAFARVSHGAAAGGRGHLWQRRLASMGICTLFERDDTSVGLTSGSDSLLVDPSIQAWLEILCGLPARRAELIRIGDNARRLLTLSEIDPAAVARRIQIISALSDA